MMAARPTTLGLVMSAAPVAAGGAGVDSAADGAVLLWEPVLEADSLAEVAKVVDSGPASVEPGVVDGAGAPSVVEAVSEVTGPGAVGTPVPEVPAGETSVEPEVWTVAVD